MQQRNSPKEPWCGNPVVRSGATAGWGAIVFQQGFLLLASESLDNKFDMLLFILQ
jgi:hypothetical protein